MIKLNKPLALGADHGGYALKEEIKLHLDEIGVKYKDYGSFTGEAIDYPDIAKLTCENIQNGNSDVAILFCGTGIGIGIAANKMHGIRACSCSDTFSAKFTRIHNDANVLCLGGRVVGAGLAAQLVDLFLEAEFEGGRHLIRVNKITALENKA